jgi:hypothetical protein
MSVTNRVHYEVRRTEAEETIEHQTYNTAQHKEVTALTVYETNAWFAVKIQK